MDWEAEGLLEGVEGEARDARRSLLDELHDDGVALEELKRAVAEERLAVLPLERRLAGDAKYTAREMAEESGMDLDRVLAFRRAYGLAVPDPDERSFSEEDLEDLRRGLTLVEAGLPMDDLLAVERVLGLGMARYAETFRSAFAQAFLRQGDTEEDVARRYAEAFEAMRPQAGPHFAHIAMLHLRQLVRSDVLSQEERETGRVRGREEMAVGFADLVGFTKLGEQVGHEELGGVATRLTDLTLEVVRSPVRLVKTIGDAVMLVSPEPEPMLHTLLALVDSTDTVELPELRAGLAYGPAVSRGGDWFGSTVNLASRIAARARPGSVLATQEAREAIGDDDGLEWSYAGEKKLKGFTAPVKAHRARIPSPDGDGDER